MSGRTLYCTRCAHPIVVSGELPKRCPQCGSGAWTSAINPRVPFQLTPADREFLRTIRIAAGDDAPARRSVA